MSLQTSVLIEKNGRVSTDDGTGRIGCDNLPHSHRDTHMSLSEVFGPVGGLGLWRKRMIDRSEVNRALAKAIAYKQCGKDELASAWAAKLVDLLECASIIDPSYRAFAEKRGISAM